MKSWKAQFMAAFAVMALLVASAQAQTSTAPTQTGGTASVGYSGSSGDTTNGGYAAGNGRASFNASDPSFAQGNATAAGAGSTNQNVGTTSVSSTAKSVLNTQGVANGSMTDVSLGGKAQQGNWDGLGGSTNYTSAGNTTAGGYTGTDAAQAPLQGNGTGTAKGTSTGTLNGVGTDDVTATANTLGSSKGSTSFQTADNGATPVVSSNASGMGVLGAQSVAGDPTGAGSFAGGTAAGTAAYTGTNPTGAQTAGSLAICGKTNGKINGGNVSASSVVNSTAQLNP